MKRIVIAGLIFAAGACGVQANDLNIRIRKLNTTEANLVYEHKRTIGLRKYEIERQLKSIREQRAALTAQRKARANYYNSKTANQQVSTYRPPSPRKSTYKVWRPPQPDWKDVEHPGVLVKGSAKIRDEEVALVTGGKIIYSNDVFSTTYQGEERIWRCTEVSGMSASFERINPDGTPWPPKKSFWEKVKWWE